MAWGARFETMSPSGSQSQNSYKLHHMHRAGEEAGLREGKQLGVSRGFEIGLELGFITGSVQVQS